MQIIQLIEPTTARQIILKINEIIENFNNADTTIYVSFTPSSDRSNISPNENLSTLFGKIVTWFNDFGELAWMDIQDLPFENSSSNIKMDGIVSAGTLYNIARSDHTHPVDTSRAPATHTLPVAIKLSDNDEFQFYDVSLGKDEKITKSDLASAIVGFSSFEQLKYGSFSINLDTMELQVRPNDLSYVEYELSNGMLSINYIDEGQMFSLTTGDHCNLEVIL